MLIGFCMIECISESYDISVETVQTKNFFGFVLSYKEKGF